MKNKYLILGGGHQGLAMAAHLSLNDEYVSLWNRSEENIAEILKTHEIKCHGILEDTAVIQKVSTCIDEVLEKVIMVTTPSSAHKDIAHLLAKRVTEDNIIILNPGRTFGAIEFVKELKAAGCRSIPKIAETQTIVYTCRRFDENSAIIYAKKREVLISALQSNELDEIMSVIPECLKSNFKRADNMLETSLNNVGMILHCAPVLMNIGWIENTGSQFKYYREGISRSITRFISKIDKERIEVGKALGIRLESVQEWIGRTYNVKGENLYDCIQNNGYYSDIDAPETLKHRYIEEDVPCGLVPLENVAEYYGVKTPYISLTIDLACAVMEKNYRETGRKITKEDLYMIQ